MGNPTGGFPHKMPVMRQHFHVMKSSCRDYSDRLKTPNRSIYKYIYIHLIRHVYISWYWLMPSIRLLNIAGYYHFLCCAQNRSDDLVNSLVPGQNGCHFTDNVFGCIFVNEKFCILIKISMKFVPKGLIDNDLGLVKIMAWHRIGDKPLSEPMLTRFPDTCKRH